MGKTYGNLNFADKGTNWGAAGTTLDMGGIFKLTLRVNITINTNTSFNGIHWDDGNTNENAHTFLHELGHAFDILKGSGGSVIKSPDDVPFVGKDNSAWNDWKIDQECFGGQLGYKKPE